MKEKILDVSTNDLYGNVDLRKAEVFACFNHKKYNNKYVIFTFLGELDKKKLYYGSAFLKNDSLVIFSINQDNLKYIENFEKEYLTGKLDEQEYEIIDLKDISKVELVSYDNIESEDLIKLEELSIKKEIDSSKKVNEKKKPAILYVLLVVLIAALIGLTYFYFNPKVFMTKYTKMNCQTKQYNHKLNMNYLEEREFLFDKNNKLKKEMVYENYIFPDESKYNDFKDQKKENEYFKIDGTFKYNDEKLELKIIYKDESIIDNYLEMKKYLEDKQYTCNEEVYYE